MQAAKHVMNLMQAACHEHCVSHGPCLRPFPDHFISGWHTLELEGITADTQEPPGDPVQNALDPWVLQ